jgi:hypothetical protein
MACNGEHELHLVELLTAMHVETSLQRWMGRRWKDEDISYISSLAKRGSG